MNKLPEAMENVTKALESGFTKPTHSRVMVLLAAAILTVGARTMSNILRTAGALMPGHPSTWCRILSRARIRLWKIARALAVMVVDAFCPDGTILLAGDDTVEEHRGAKVFGKGCHRDAVHSSHTYTAFRWGHKWVVLCVLVAVPWSSRLWALPVLVSLYRPVKDNEQSGRRHRTPVDLMRQMLCVMLRWFPERKLLFVGDGAFATHNLARFAARHRRQLTLVSRFYADANLYAAPPHRKQGQNGRPRLKGRKLDSPETVVAAIGKRRRLKVKWYGGAQRNVEIVTSTGHWYQGGAGLVEIRWVFVHDRSGTHRDEYFFTTDAGLSAKAIIESYTGRWSIETMFQEMHSCLGLSTTRGHKEKTILRAAPMLFSLYTLVVLLYRELPKRYQSMEGVIWRGKSTVTFSDILIRTRCWLWTNWVFETLGETQPFSKLHKRFQSTILHAITTVT